MIFYHKANIIPGRGWVWVFGSNEAGIHSKGDSRIAKNNFGALYGVSRGRVGMSFAILVANRHLMDLPMRQVGQAVGEFIEYARNSPNERFHVSEICAAVAPLFRGAPENCFLPESWRESIESCEVNV